MTNEEKLDFLLKQFPIIHITRDELTYTYPDYRDFLLTLTDDQMEKIADSLMVCFDEFWTTSLEISMEKQFPEMDWSIKEESENSEDNSPHKDTDDWYNYEEDEDDSMIGA